MDKITFFFRLLSRRSPLVDKGHVLVADILDLSADVPLYHPHNLASAARIR